MREIEDFSLKASLHRTPSKADRKRVENVKFVPNITATKRKGMVEHFKANKDKFTLRTVEHIENLEEYVVILESQLENTMIFGGSTE